MPACKQLLKQAIVPFVRTTVGSTIQSTTKASQFDTRATAPPVASPISGKFRRLTEIHERHLNPSPEADEYELINVKTGNESKVQVPQLDDGKL